MKARKNLKLAHQAILNSSWAGWAVDWASQLNMVSLRTKHVRPIHPAYEDNLAYLLGQSGLLDQGLTHQIRLIGSITRNSQMKRMLNRPINTHDQRESYKGTH